jgi:hypothetical protein
LFSLDGEFASGSCWAEAIASLEAAQLFFASDTIFIPDAQNQFFYAALEPPTSAKPQFSLNSGELAKRFGIGSSTIRNAKRTKSPEKFADFSQQHDPDGLAWRFDSQSHKYVCIG